MKVKRFVADVIPFKDGMVFAPFKVLEDQEGNRLYVYLPKIFISYN